MGLEVGLAELRRVGYAVAEEGDLLRLTTPVDVIDRGRLQERLQTVALGRSVGCQVETASTNDLAVSAAYEGAPHGSVILAEYQTRGRGRAGRHWHSPPNCGLWLSVVLRLADVDARSPGMMTLGAGVAAAAAVEQATGTRPALKWPNDILFDGRKMGGILCERHEKFAVIGIGVNVNHAAEDFPDDLRDSAISLGQITGTPLHREDVLADLLLGLEAILDETGDSIRERWLLFWGDRGRQMQFTVESGLVDGIARGLSDDGGLVMETADGVRTVYAGDVVPLTVK